MHALGAGAIGIAGVRVGCGLAVVAFNRAAARQLIIHESNGLLVESEENETFGRQVHRVVVDRDLRQKLGQNARQSSLENGWASVLDQTEEVLRRVSHKNSLGELLSRPIYARAG